MIFEGVNRLVARNQVIPILEKLVDSVVLFFEVIPVHLSARELSPKERWRLVMFYL